MSAEFELEEYNEVYTLHFAQLIDEKLFDVADRLKMPDRFVHLMDINKMSQDKLSYIIGRDHALSKYNMLELTRDLPRFTISYISKMLLRNGVTINDNIIDVGIHENQSAYINIAYEKGIPFTLEHIYTAIKYGRNYALKKMLYYNKLNQLNGRPYLELNHTCYHYIRKINSEQATVCVLMDFNIPFTEVDALIVSVNAELAYRIMMNALKVDPR